jgi:hypothetical protein
MVYQYRPRWSGTTGGPGVTVFNARRGLGSPGFPQQFADAVRPFFSALTGRVPNEVSWSFPGEVLEYDTVTGKLIEVYPVTAPANVVATSTGGYSHASGGRVDWHTQAIVNGKRLRGRSFIVPMAGSEFGPDGVLTAGARSALTNAANGLITAMAGPGGLVVWSRTHGIVADVESASVVAKGSVLRTRRD